MKKTTKKRQKEKRVNGWNLLGVIFGIVGILGTIITAVAYRAYLNDKRTIPTSGKIDAPKPADKRILAIGSARFIVDSADGVLIREDNDPLISVHKFNDKLFVSAVIRNTKGEIVARLDDNEWQLNSKNYYDRNFNQKAIEVVDHSGNVVLQVVDLGDIIHFAGIFHRKDGTPFALIPVGEFGALMKVGVEDRFVILSSAYVYRNPNIPAPKFRNPKITPIFEYPSVDHLGSCPGMDALIKIARLSDNDDKYKGYRMGGSVDIGYGRMPKTTPN